MEIEILYRPEGAEKARGLAVIIDVFRTFTTACYVMDKGAEKIIPVADLELAYQLKSDNPNFVLMGERQGYPPAGFDFGNSPSQLKDADFTRRTVVLTTSLGTQAITKAKNAREILTGSFVNANAVVEYLKFRNPARVSLVCTATINEAVLDEDALCARYLKNCLTGQPDDLEGVAEHLKDRGFADPFFDPERDSHPVEDFELCLAVNRFDFVLRAEPYRSGLVCLKKIELKGKEYLKSKRG